MAGEADQAHGQPGSEKWVTSMDTIIELYNEVLLEGLTPYVRNLKGPIPSGASGVTR